jgi:hypothetical protein
MPDNSCYDDDGSTGSSVDRGLAGVELGMRLGMGERVAVGSGRPWGRGRERGS